MSLCLLCLPFLDTATACWGLDLHNCVSYVIVGGKVMVETILSVNMCVIIVAASLQLVFTPAWRLTPIPNCSLQQFTSRELMKSNKDGCSASR